jgi:hypothetical protein
MRTLLCLALPAVLVLSGCSTDRRYTYTGSPVAHDQLVRAAEQAISEESRVSLDKIEQSEKSEGAGRLTTLNAPYNIYSHIRVEVDSRKDCDNPELLVQISTDKILWTRHKEWEQRIHEIVTMKLRGRTHGPESKPTSVPPTAPPAPEAKPARG